MKLPPGFKLPPGCTVGPAAKLPGVGAKAARKVPAYSEFVEGCKARGWPEPVRELMFAPPRRWKFDFAFPSRQIAVEVEGGVWTRGRHTRGSGFLRDMDKYNEASILGWLLLRTTPDGIKTGRVFEALERAFSSEKSRKTNNHGL